METQRFDELTKVLSTRRRALRGLAGSAAGLLMLLGTGTAEAKRGGNGKAKAKGRGKGKGRGRGGDSSAPGLNRVGVCRRSGPTFRYIEIPEPALQEDDVPCSPVDACTDASCDANGCVTESACGTGTTCNATTRQCEEVVGSPPVE